MELSNVIGIAYVNTRKQQEELKKKRKNKKKKNVGCLNFLFEILANWYLSDKKYCHCEIAFEKEGEVHDDDKCIAYGVFSDVGVFCEKRTFSNPAYDWIYITTTDLQKKRALSFCNKQVGKQFDYWGAHLMPFWSGQGPKGDKWWCGSFTLAVLHEAGILNECRNGAMNIDDIIESLQDHPNRIESMSPYNIIQLVDHFNKDF